MFYEKVKRLCADKGISITALALELGFSRSAPNAWQKMTSPPRAMTVKKVAEYFRVPPEQLTSSEEFLKVSDGASATHDAQELALLRLFEQLSVMDKAKVLIYTNDLVNNKDEK